MTTKPSACGYSELLRNSIWLHYFHANDTQVRKNYLNWLFFDHSQAESRKYRQEVLWDFWRDTKRENRQKIFRELVKDVGKQEQNDRLSDATWVDSLFNLDEDQERGESSRIDTPLFGSSHLNPTTSFTLFGGWRIGSKVLDQIKIKESLSSYAKSEQDEFIPVNHLSMSVQSELAYLVALGTNMYEVDHFLNFLFYSKLDRWEIEFDKHWRLLLKLIDETQREITLNELLDDEDTQNSEANTNDDSLVKLTAENPIDLDNLSNKGHKTWKSSISDSEEVKSLIFNWLYSF